MPLKVRVERTPSMLPRDLMPWDAAHRWFAKWRKDDAWDRIHDALRRQVRQAAGRDLEPSAAVLDAQTIKSSDGGEARGYDAGKRTTGRKRHIAVDTMGLLLVVMVTSASAQDHARYRWMRIERTWPWADACTTCWTRLSTLPAAT